MNSDRRKFLKVLAMGGAVVVAGRILGKGALALASGGENKKKGVNNNQDNQLPQDIQTVRRGKNVVFVDRSTGEEIFILERE